jgi:hypothetical protein
MNVQPTTTPIQVQIANQQYMQSTHTAELPVQGIPPAARQVHVFPNMATNLLAPGPLVQQGCTLQMDSKQCLIQCPNCHPIRCPINSQGLYLLPATATAYNTIDVDGYDTPTRAALALAEDVDEYIEYDNQARFAAAARDLSEHYQSIAADDEQSEQEYEFDDDGAEPPELLQEHDDDDAAWQTTSYSELANQARFIAAAATPKRNNVSRWGLRRIVSPH